MWVGKNRLLNLTGAFVLLDSGCFYYGALGIKSIGCAFCVTSTLALPILWRGKCFDFVEVLE